MLTLLWLCTAANAVPIIIKDITPSAPFLKYSPQYSVQLKPVSQLHTLAIPKVYLAPSIAKQSITLTSPIVAKVPVIPTATRIPIIPTIRPIVVKDLSGPDVAPIIVKSQGETYDPNPGYRYSYAVSDPNTGDSKSAEETLENGIVRGSYSLSESDGSIRLVTYRADNINGFQATVEKIGSAHHLPTLIRKYLGALPFSAINHSTKSGVPPYKARPIYHATPTASILPSLATRHYHRKD